MSRRITPSTSVDNLKHEAKRWLKAIRASDTDALRRFRAALASPPESAGLRDVQLALAREFGFAGWVDLTRGVEAARQTRGDDDANLRALITASLAGDVAQVRAILDAHPELVNRRAPLPGHTGARTALHFAINAPHEDVVRLLLDRGADPNIRDDGDNAFPLHFAAEKGHLGVIRLLIEHGADPIGHGDMHELEVIGWLTVFGKADAEIVRYLLDHGARHNISSAVATGEVDAIRELVTHDRTLLECPMDRANRCRHPLHLAVVKRQPASLDTLLDLGAGTEARDSAGFTALDQAALDGQQGIVDTLTAHGATIDLPAALALGRIGDVDRLLRAEPKAVAPGGRLATLVIRAAEAGNVPALETILAHGGDANIEDEESEAVDGTIGYTALHAAAFRGHIDAVRLLLDHGASVTTRDSTYSGSPAGWAAYAGHDAVRDLILDGPIDIIDAIEYDRPDRVRQLVADDPTVLTRRLGSHFRVPPRSSDWLDVDWIPLQFAEAQGNAAIATILRGAAQRAALDAQLINRFLENACPDHHVRGASAHVRALHTAMRLLEQHPWLATATLATRVVTGDLDGVRAILDADPSLINAAAPSPRDGVGHASDQDRDLAPKTWSPLLFLSFTRLALPATNDNAVAMAELLLDRGADPNAFFMAGGSRYTPLVGVIGEGEEDRPAHPQRDALVQLLLDRAAEPYDQQVGYNIGFHGQVLWFLRMIHARALAIGRARDWADPEWDMLNMGNYGSGARWYLGIAIAHDDAELARWCLEHGANPAAPPPRGRRLPQGSLFERAMRGDHREIARLLVEFGAEPEPITLTDAEQLLVAALDREPAVARGLVERNPALSNDATAIDAAIRQHRADAVTLLLDAGVSIEVANHDGERPLHIAAWSNALETAQRLIDRGAEVDAIRGNYHNTALGAAGYFRFTAMIDLLARHSRDIWELVYLGRVERVRELLDEEPSLARVRSGQQTLLMWLPVDDESRAIEIARLLLALGADPSVRNTDGKTAADRAERIGMSQLATLLRDAETAGEGGERPAVEMYDAMAQRLLEAYRTGTPDAMERHYADTWHRREWTGMRTDVLADLGIRHDPDAAFPDITLDDARRWIANDHRFRSWDALATFVASIPPRQRSITRVPVGAARDERHDSERMHTRDWDALIDTIAARHFTAVYAHGQMTDAVLARIAELPAVTVLDLGASRQLTDRGVRSLARMTQLRHLGLVGTSISDDGMSVLRHLPNLEVLRLGHTRITDAGAAELAHCRSLRHVGLMWTRTGDGAIRALAGIDTLRHFASGNDVSDAGLAAVRDIPAYRAWRDESIALDLLSPDAEPNMLTLRGTFTDRGMDALVGLDGLFGLSLASQGITARGLEPLVALANLGKLSFDAHDDAMPIIARMPHLRFLSVQDTDATDDGWIALAASRSIEGIWGRRCHGLRDRGFAALATMPALRQLSVSCRNVSDDAVALLPAFPALRELMPIDIPDEGYRHIARCKRLDTLTLMYCRDTGDRATELITPLRHLRKYFASYTQITDRTPELLATILSLEDVTFDSCAGLSDAGIAALARLPRLVRARFSGMPNVTAASRAAFNVGVDLTIDD